MCLKLNVAPTFVLDICSSYFLIYRKLAIVGSIYDLLSCIENQGSTSIEYTLDIISG